MNAAPIPRHDSQSSGEPMRESVERFAERRRRWRREAGRTIFIAATVAGLGWVVVVPAVAGFALGHWLDVRYQRGVLFSAGLGLLGLAFGCWAAWRRVAHHREEREDKS